MRKYMRMAEVLVDNFGDVFPPLPDSLLHDDQGRCERAALHVPLQTLAWVPTAP
jgi:hypothetical protein